MPPKEQRKEKKRPNSSSEDAPSWAEQYTSDRKREAGIREGVLAQPKSLPTGRRRRRRGSTPSVLSEEEGREEGGSDADGHDGGDGRDEQLERKSNFSLDLSEETAGTSLAPVPRVSRICTKWIAN